jgi:hypothetical protein
LQVTCPTCAQSLKILDDLLGKTIRCPVCKKTMKVESAPTAVPVLQLAAQPKRQRAFLIWPIVVGVAGGIIFLVCAICLAIVRNLPDARTEVPQAEPFAKEGPIEVGKFRIDCSSSALCGPLPLMDVHGIGLEMRSVGTSLLLTFSIENTTDTEILSFPGLDEASPRLEDFFGNFYAQCHWQGYAFAKPLQIRTPFITALQSTHAKRSGIT